jgi:hypothetical protein
MKQQYVRNVLVVLAMLHDVHAKTFIAPDGHGMHASLTGPRISSSPYISGDTFRAVCDVIIDEKRIPFDPARLQPGDVIFVKTDLLGFFFTVVAPHIRYPYILITHNSDAPAPGKYARHLNDASLIAWFGQNSNCAGHPKFFPIPIGLANAYWPHGDVRIIDQIRAEPLEEKRYQVYANFAKETHPGRVKVANLFKSKPFCYHATRKPYAEYIREMKRAVFVLSPRGNGLDCHRHWEALWMGSIPIVEHSTLDPLFDGLPVILVNNWHEVTESFLHEQYERIQQQTFELERMFAPYWIGKIEALKKEVKQRYKK